jgi:hypothetical protein
MDEEPKKKPRNVRELYEEVPEPETPEEPEPVSPLELKADEGAEEPAEEGDIPSWAMDHLPEGFRIPKGKQVVFLRFQSAWTDEPSKGVLTTYRTSLKGAHIEKEVLSRVLVCWPLSLAEAKSARRRARDNRDVLEELTKQMVRAVDGKRVDWSGSWAKRPEELVDANQAWRELGVKVHPLVTNAYLKLHSLTDDELADFYLNCIVVTSAVAG